MKDHSGGGGESLMYLLSAQSMNLKILSLHFQLEKSELFLTQQNENCTVLILFI